LEDQLIRFHEVVLVALVLALMAGVITG